MRLLLTVLLVLFVACASLDDGDLSNPDGTSEGKALAVLQTIAPAIRGALPIRKVMRTRDQLTGNAPANAKLAFFGGQIVEKPTYVNVFWGSYWTSGAGLSERNYMNSFAQAVLPSSAFLSAMIEYTGPAGKTIHQGAFTGEKLIGGEPGGTSKKISNDQIRSAIDSWIAGGVVPAPSLDVIYALHFPPGVQITLGTDASCSSFCGYHNTVQTVRGSGGFIRYIVLPFPDCFGCNFESAARDSLTVVYSHEAWETATDPDVGIAIDTNQDKWLGWYDNNNGENADICAGDPNATLQGFRVQTTWSNAEKKCVASRDVGTPAPDFSVAINPASQTIAVGGSTSYAVTVVPANGFAGDVSFAPVGGLQTGVSGGVVGPVHGGGQTTLNIATNSTAVPATLTLTVTATSGGLSHTATASLTINAAPRPDFSLAVSPAAVAIDGGKSGTAAVSIAATGGFTAGVALTASGLPSGVSASFSPATVPGAGASTLTLAAATTAPAAHTTVTITGTAGALTHSASVDLTVTPAAQPDFSVSVSPAAATIDAGKSAQAMVTIGAISGFDGAVALASSGAPAGVTVSFDHASIPGAGTATLTLAASASAAAGTFALTISGTSGARRHTAAFSLTVRTSGAVFSDDAESGMRQWITYAQHANDPVWSIEASTASNSGAHRFRSNAGRNYANNTATFLISRSFSLAGASTAVLTFFYKYELESGFDFFYVWVSGDDGATWTRIAGFTGTSPGWNRWAPQARFDLGRWAGKSAARIAFSLQSDSSVTNWGVGLDDIKVTTTGSTLVAGD